MRFLVNKFTLLCVFICGMMAAKDSFADVQVQISRFGKLSFGTWAGEMGGVHREQELCVYASQGSSYYITATPASGSTTSFQMQSGENAIDYEVDFKGSSGAFEGLTLGAPKQFSEPSATINCGGGTNASLRVRISNSTLRGAYEGTYRGSIYIRLDPG